MLVAYPAPLDSTPEAKSPRPQLAPGHRRIWGLTLVSVSIILFWLSFVRFWAIEPGASPDRLPWDYFTTGMLIMVVGGLTLFTGTPQTWKIRPWHAALLVAIVAYALYTRIHDLGEYPFGIWFDEAVNGIAARAMDHNPQYRPVLFNHMSSQLLLRLYNIGLDIFGVTNIVGVRIVEALFGVGAVIMAYAVGSQLRGPWFGLLMAFFMAIMRWSINFSRIGMPGIEATFFLLLSFYFLYRYFQRHRWRDAFLFGIATGLGLWFYAAFRFTALALIVYALLKSRFWRQPRIVGIGLLMVLAVLITIFPLAVYAYHNTDAFTERSRQVLIIYSDVRQASTLTEALWNNIESHLRMFHIEGDRNGRHNLPKEPMLGPIMGALMVLGIGLALRGWRRLEEWFFLIVFTAGLGAAILTLEWEAPQALRSIGILPAIAYFCSLATFAIGQLLWETRQTRILLIVTILGLAASLWINHQIYFDTQRYNLDVWKSYSTYETITGHVASARPYSTRIYYSPLVGYSPSAEFLNPNIANRQAALTLPDAIPLRIPPTNPVTVILHEDDGWLYEYSQLHYPHAQFSAIHPSDYGIDMGLDRALFYIIDLTPADIANVQGLEEDGTGILYAPSYGDYYFDVPANALVFVNDIPVQSSEQAIQLSVGNHPIRIEPPDAAIEWKPPGSHLFQPIREHFLYHEPVASRGFLGSYYPNENWVEPPALQRIDPTLDVFFHHLPLMRPYTVSWKGWLIIDTPGEYLFQLLAVEWAELRIDAQPVLTVPERGQTVTASMSLQAHEHLVEVRFLDNVSHSEIRLRWRPPNQQEFTTIPPGQIIPYTAIPQP